MNTTQNDIQDFTNTVGAIVEHIDEIGVEGWVTAQGMCARLFNYNVSSHDIIVTDEEDIAVLQRIVQQEGTTDFLAMLDQYYKGTVEGEEV